MGCDWDYVTARCSCIKAIGLRRLGTGECNVSTKKHPLLLLEDLWSHLFGVFRSSSTCSALTCLVSSTEDELKEKLHLQVKTEYRYSDVNYNSIVHINNVSKAEELHAEGRLAPVPPSLPLPSMPVAVIPIPVVTPNPTGSPTLPVATLSPPAAPPLASPKRDPHSLQEQSAAALLCSPQPKAYQPTSVVTTNHIQTIQNHHHSHLITQTSNTKLHEQTHQQLVQSYPCSIVSPPKELALLPHSGPVLQPALSHNGAISRGSPPDDGRQQDSKKRPGG